MRRMLTCEGQSKEYEEDYGMHGNCGRRTFIPGHNGPIQAFYQRYSVQHEDSRSILVEILGCAYENKRSITRDSMKASGFLEGTRDNRKILKV